MAYNVPPQLKTVIGIAESNQEIKKKKTVKIENCSTNNQSIDSLRTQ